jgi:endoglucanase
MGSHRRAVAALTAAGVAAGILISGGSASNAAPPIPTAVRVDQVGYGVTEAKQAYLMAGVPSANATFSVVDAGGKTVLSGKVGASRGRWNNQFGAVHPIDFSRLKRPGTYRIKAATATSPVFRIGSSSALFGRLAQDSTHFFQVQRDGASVVPTRLDRKPSHLTDRKATVYEHPVFSGDGGDVPAEPLKPVAGAAPVDVEGGWFDAGDFVKFTHASAYSTAELLYVQRGGSPGHTLDAETRHGLKWLDKAWDAKRKVLYVQVGIGTGSEEFGFLGDHDVWRLPEADDALNAKPGDPEYFIKYRPVFRASPPGGKISPNLAGRISASFALAAQVEARRNPRLARHYLDEGASIFALAKTTDVGELVTAFPHAYYPEDSWEDDLEFGATELALAARLLGDRRAGGWLHAAGHWAKAYLASDHRDTLNLYDTSALAHTDLIRLLRACRGRLAVDERALVADLRRQLDSGVATAAESPFGGAADVTNFDVATRSLGFAATARLYRSITGDRRYDTFGTQQRNFVLGANAWGTSLVVGAGTVFPHCPQHQVSNLAGSNTGGRKVVVGAVVNGPNGASNFEDLGIPDGANVCPVDGVNKFAAYDTAESRYLDDVRAWPSSEPAIDFTSTGMLAFALASRG